MEFRPHSRPEKSHDIPLDVGSDIHTLTETYVWNQAEKQWRGPKFLNYTTYRQGIQSFTNWPSGKNPSPQALSAAGFYYTGTWNPFFLFKIIFLAIPSRM
jgi:hypothetical protein